jgi:hypothetical protein
MVDIGPFDVGGNAIRYSQHLFDAGFPLAFFQPGMAFTKRFRNRMSQSFACRIGDGVREPVSFRIFDVETHGAIFYLFT